MAAAMGVRTDYTSADLRRFARRSGDADQVRRLLAMALILDGGSRSEAAKVARVTLLIVRDWVLRFNEGRPDGLATRRASAGASILNDGQRARRAAIVEAGPILAAHGVVRCGLLIWPSGSGTSSNCRLRGTPLEATSRDGYRKPSARLRHRCQKSDYIADFKKLCRPSGAD